MALAQVCEQVAGNATAQPAGMLSQQVVTMSVTTINHQPSARQPSNGFDQLP
jgi:hypothetical protein